MANNQNNTQKYTNGIITTAVTTKGNPYQIASLGRVYMYKPEIRHGKDRDGNEVLIVSGRIPLNHFGYQLGRVPDMPEEIKTAESAWAQISVWGNAEGKGDGDRLAKYLEKAGNPKGIWFSFLAAGIKVETYQKKDGTPGHSVRLTEMAMEIAPRASQGGTAPDASAAQSVSASKAESAPAASGFTVIEDDDDELPF